MADNKAVNQTAAKPEEAKADKKAKANDGKKKVPFTAKVKNFFGRITKYFRDTKSELKKVVWPSKEDTRNNTITVIVVVVIAAVVLVLLDDKGMLHEVQVIDLSDAARITMQYMGRFQVEFLWNADFDYKLDYLAAVVEKLEANEKGTIDMTQDGKASFIPS